MTSCEVVHINALKNEIDEIKLKRLNYLEKELKFMLDKYDNRTPDGDVPGSKSKLYCKYCLGDIYFKGGIINVDYFC